MKRIVACIMALLLAGALTADGLMPAAMAEGMVIIEEETGDAPVMVPEDGYPVDTPVSTVEEIEAFEIGAEASGDEAQRPKTTEPSEEADAAPNSASANPSFPIEIKISDTESGQFDFSLEDRLSVTPSDCYDPYLSEMLLAISGAAYNTKLSRSGQLTVKNAGFDRYKSDEWNEKHRELYHITKAYHDLGFEDYEAFNYYNDYNDPAYGADNVAFTVGAKKLSDGQSLVLIAVRGSYGAFDLGRSDWQSNIKVKTRSDGTHYGFGTAADKAYDKVKAYLEKRYTKKDIKSKVKFVLTGHSRGAGVANLLALQLKEYGIPNDRVYDYNFACPDVARHFKLIDWGKGHENIFNINYTADAVGFIPGIVGDEAAPIIDVSVLDIFNDWGKYGHSWYFSYNWDSAREFDLFRTFSGSGSSHDCKNYLGWLKKHDTTFGTWADVLPRFLDSILYKVVKVFFPGAERKEADISKALEKTGDNGTIKVEVGKTIAFVPQFALENAWQVSWTSSDPASMWISGNVAKAKKIGKVKITATTSKSALNKKKEATIVVEIVPKSPTDIELDKTEATLEVGKSIKLKANILPSGAKSKLTWSTSDKNVAKVSDAGVVKGINPGTATITVKTENGKKATCRVTIVANELMGYFLQDYKAVAKQLDLQINKIKVGKYTTYECTSSEIKISSCQATQITGIGLKKGTRFSLMDVTVGMDYDTAKRKVKAYCDGMKKYSGKWVDGSDGNKCYYLYNGSTLFGIVTLKRSDNKITGVSFHIDPVRIEISGSAEKTVEVGKTLNLKAKQTPMGTSARLTWSSSDKGIATVSSSGAVKGIKPGKAKITVETANGKKATVKITVKSKPIELSGYLEMDIYKAAKKLGLTVHRSSKPFTISEPETKPLWIENSAFKMNNGFNTPKDAIKLITIKSTSNYSLYGIYIGMDYSKARSRALEKVRKMNTAWAIIYDREQSCGNVFEVGGWKGVIRIEGKNGKVSSLSLEIPDVIHYTYWI